MPDTMFNAAEKSSVGHWPGVDNVHATSLGKDLASFLFRSFPFLAFLADCLDRCLSFLLVKVL